MGDSRDLEKATTEALRASNAKFAFVFGSQAEGTQRPESDLDVAAWWGEDPPDPWDVALPAVVDLIVLDKAPLWLAGRVALHGRVLFDDDPPARVAWQADTRFIYLDEIPQLRQRQREWLEGVADGR
ncbi:MAG: nucleotidyltransferase domain-containing protein [Acidimicrobiia bacterium]|nr:nucleotidyltransferase domain-containing protein [Acidimicrobiia bacterium]